MAKEQSSIHFETRKLLFVLNFQRIKNSDQKGPNKSTLASQPIG